MGKYDEMMRQHSKPAQDVTTRDYTRCWHHDCPMKASVRTSNGSECTFHFGQEGFMHSYITKAIRNNELIIKQFSALSQSSLSAFNANDPNSLINQITFIKMADNELPTRFLTRFHQAMHDHILKEATLDHQGGFYQ